jgi:hypothetical protein
MDILSICALVIRKVALPINELSLMLFLAGTTNMLNVVDRVGLEKIG